MTSRKKPGRAQNKAARFIALRHVTSRHNRGFFSFITAIAIVGVTLGVASLVITLSILDGFERTIKENVVSFTAHMELFAFQNQVLPGYEGTRRRVMEQFPEVVEMAPYLTREGMIRSQGNIDGVMIKGVDPANDISAAKRRLVAGRYDLTDSDGGVRHIILGKRLSERLEAPVGARVLLYSLGGASLSLSQSRVLQATVVGIYETGMADYDGTIAYVDLPTAQRLFQVGRTVSGFDILVTDVDSLASLSRRIPETLGYPYYARTMQQMYHNLFSWIDLQKKPVPLILGLIIIVATFNIVGTLLMMVLEKSKQIGTLRALGMSRNAVVRIFLNQGLFIGIAGTILGDLLALLICWLELKYRFFPLPSGIYFMTHVPIDLSIWNFLVVSATAIGLSVLASILPSRVASKMDPVRLIRFGS